MKKTHLFLALFMILATFANAQNDYGIYYFGIGEYANAKKYFEDQIAAKPAESNYYLGEIAWAQGKADDAKAYYEKGISADPTYLLNYIGQAKLILKSDQKKAEEEFSLALKKNKKNVPVNVAIARAYYENGMRDAALAKIELVRKFAKKSPLLYTLEGDILKDSLKYGDAAGKYEQALYFDPSYTVASMKCAEVYETINPTLSIDILKKVIAKYPDFIVAYRNLGKTYCQTGQYNDAIDVYKTYFEKGQYNVEDIIRYASAYYFTDKYDESVKLIDEGLKIAPDNFVLNRLKMYNAVKTKDFENGLKCADYFFTLRTSTPASYITQDYSTYGALLSEAGQYDKAVEQYKKALSGDVNEPAIYKEASSAYTKLGDNVDAAQMYDKYIAAVGADKAEAVDYYQMGRSYYAAGISMMNNASDSIKTLGKGYLIKADSAFAVVCQMSPDSYTGYMWRGHTNAALDPETTQGLAKPYYEATIEKILNRGNGSSNKELVNAYQYLGYYYYLKADKNGSAEDKANSIKYWTKILEIDPNNANAKQVLDSYKK